MRTLIVLPAIALFALSVSTAASAQSLPQPPSTIAGSITDAAGPVPEGVKVEALVNNNVCGETETVYTGEGDSRITVYALDVHSDNQTPGCGQDGDAVRIRVGDRLAQESVPWKQGELTVFHIVFGDATPPPIPTFTPTATATATPTLSAAEATAQSATQTVTAGTPGDGDDDGSPQVSPNASVSASASASGTASSSPVIGEANVDDDGDGGFPMWAAVLLGLGGIAAIGGGIGYAMTRSRSAPA